MSTLKHEIPEHLFGHGCKQLYQLFLKDSKVEGGKIVFDASDMHPNWSKIIEELCRVGWMKKTPNPTKFSLGEVILVHRLYSDPSTEEIGDAYLLRYSSYQRDLIEEVFKLLGQKKRAQTMSLAQMITELAYFSDYAILTIERACVVFITLDHSKNWGEAYLHGIIRNEEMTTPIPSSTLTQTLEGIHAMLVTPQKSANVTIQKNVERQVEITRIFNERITGEMTPKDEYELLRQVEEEVDARR